MSPKNMMALRRIVLREKLSMSETQVYFYLLGVQAKVTILKELLDLSPSAVEKAVARLKSLGLLQVVSEEGRSKILTAVYEDLDKLSNTKE